MNDRAVGIIISNNKVLTFWRYRNGLEYYILPGGTMEEGEIPEETLKREMLEEMNLNIKIEKLFLEYFNTHERPRTDYYFLIKQFSGEIKLGAPELTHQHRENIYRPEWIELDKLKEVNLMPLNIKSKILESYHEGSLNFS